ncbi:MAG TPA: hypothetical protein PL085_11775 [Agriterribacter sp.]|uniref:hypothetical protein n=1 Tax=Agriterribacter sp. TaxID=2821509 RepID=UPI002C6AECE2|nr:hypothetical protein [Agriterribacter sp.]HRQ17748.1 hypothetical protein [Agriterribacter sp.]
MSEQKKATDFLIECGNPEAFDRTINSMGAAALVENGGNGQYLKKDGYYVMRVFGDAGFLKFAIQNQGYGKIIKELDELV